MKYLIVTFVTVLIIACSSKTANRLSFFSNNEDVTGMYLKLQSWHYQGGKLVSTEMHMDSTLLYLDDTMYVDTDNPIIDTVNIVTSFQDADEHNGIAFFDSLSNKVKIRFQINTMMKRFTYFPSDTSVYDSTIVYTRRFDYDYEARGKYRIVILHYEDTIIVPIYELVTFTPLSIYNDTSFILSRQKDIVYKNGLTEGIATSNNDTTSSFQFYKIPNKINLFQYLNSGDTIIWEIYQSDLYL